MIICDRCRDSKVRPYNFKIKIESDSPHNEGVIEEISLHLCPSCIGKVQSDLTEAIHAFRLNESYLAEEDLDEPVGIGEHVNVDEKKRIKVK